MHNLVIFWMFIDTEVCSVRPSTSKAVHVQTYVGRRHLLYYYTRLFSNRAVPGTVWNWRAGLGLGRLDRDDLELARELGLLVEDAHNCVLSDFERDGQTASRAIMCSILHAKLGSETFISQKRASLHNTEGTCALRDRMNNIQ